MSVIDRVAVLVGAQPTASGGFHRYGRHFVIDVVPTAGGVRFQVTTAGHEASIWAGDADAALAAAHVLGTVSDVLVFAYGEDDRNDATLLGASVIATFTARALEDPRWKGRKAVFSRTDHGMLSNRMDLSIGDMSIALKGDAAYVDAKGMDTREIKLSESSIRTVLDKVVAALDAKPETKPEPEADQS